MRGSGKPPHVVFRCRSYANLAVTIAGQIPQQPPAAPR